MPISLHFLFGRWREIRKRRHAEYARRAALFELNDYLLRDIGLQPR